MKRRLVLTTCLLGLVAAGAGVAVAAPVETQSNHTVCVVIAKPNDYRNGQYICISTPNLP